MKAFFLSCWLAASATVVRDIAGIAVADAFSARTSPRRRWGSARSTFRRRSTALFYVDETSPSGGGGRDDPSIPSSSSSSRSLDDKAGRRENMPEPDPFTIPVIGPLPGNPPLLVGAELFLNVPTPLQWQALEEACFVHQAHLKDPNVAGINSAPLVAIIDEYTAAGGGTPGRYATIAAVLGVTTSKHQRLDLSDSGSFMESLSALHRSGLPQQGKIRLLGIGRARLHDFFYRVPSGLDDDEDDGDGLAMAADDYDDDDDYYEDEDDDEGAEMCVEVPNVVMAQFRLVLDDGSLRSDRFLADGGGRVSSMSRRSSPVHAVAEMSNLARKVQYLHADRIRLVSGIKAALVRYRRAPAESRSSARTAADPGSLPSSLSNEEEEEGRDDLDDHDGFGLLFSQKELEATQSAMDQFLSEFEGAAARDDVRTAISQEPLPPLELKTSECNNYGMGPTSCSISSIPELADAQLERLRPYYSPDRCALEEHYYEVLSFAAVRALSDYVDPADVGRVLEWQNTQDRLQQAADWMLRHVADLRQDAQLLRQRLLDCGEECTDLF